MERDDEAGAPIQEVILQYLRGPGPHRLEIGAGRNGKLGWLATDLYATDGEGQVPVIALDATKRFPLPSDCFYFVYSEHIIEHISYEHGLNMIKECYRVLKPGGVLRVVTPSLGFLMRILSSDRGPFEDGYKNWSISTFLPNAPAPTNALFLNNFMRAWGHTFIYDHETLGLSMEIAGFGRISACEINKSEHEWLRGLENENRMPEGYLALESMVIEGVKGTYRNVALGKPATQSSVSPWSVNKTPETDAAGLVSGRFSRSYNNHTGYDNPPWWRVDLCSNYRVRQVRIYNRNTNLGMMGRANRFSIDVSMDDNVWTTVFAKESDELIPGSRYAPYVWTADAEIRARYVRIRLDGPNYLHLDQVEIVGDE